MLLVLTTLLVVAASATLGILVFARNYRSPYNLSFALFAGALSLWIPANFFGSFHNPEPSTAFLFYADFALAPFLTLFFMHFGFQSLRQYYPRFSKIRSRFVLYTTLLLALALSVAAIAKLVSTPVYSAGTVNSHEEVLYNLYTAVEIIFVLAGLASIIIAATRSSKLYKQQVRTILAGVIIGTTTIILSNVVLPNLVKGGNQGASIAQDSSYFGALIMQLSFSYLIVRQRLFDVRAVLARTLGYVFVLGTLGTASALALLTVTSTFFSDVQIETSIKVVYLVTALILAIIYQPIKKRFDKLTNRLFYRDAYDSQALLNELNRSLVTTIDLEELLDKSAEIIGNTLKVAYCTFAIRGSQDPSLRLVGGTQKQFNHDAIGHAVSVVSHHADKIVVLDELESSKHHLRELMQTANISVLVRLQGTSKGHTQHPGYILLGQKRSGSLYSEQDITVLEIIADELVIAIQNALRFEEIQQFNITLEQKIDAATKELRRTNAKLKALDEAKDEFISMASHQLRTPLTAVKGYLSMVLDGDTGPVKKNQKELTQNAFDGAQRMVYLIADLLNVSRMQTGKFVIENQPSHLPEVVEAEIAQLKEQIVNREITVTYDKPERFPTLNLDETKIRQVIMNFLDNALYYTPKGGKVDVALQATDGSVTYTVTDNGVGVPKAVQHHLFSKFYRADNARKMRPDGTGLGLYMAKKVIVAQGGAIIFKSEEGKGSTFGFSFPRKGLETKSDKSVPVKVENKDK
ncbi:hypothetical protein HY857_00585 [Candidatus Saccharibacteria bacterium]|nr:hypothetical protein [Candidatus Saccharibacteria bacterium]